MRHYLTDLEEVALPTIEELDTGGCNMSGVISSLVMTLCCCLIVLLVSHAPHSVHSFITPQIHHKIHTTRDFHTHNNNDSTLLYAANNVAIQEESSSTLKQQQDDDEKSIISYSAILKAIDRDAYNEALQSCSYLVSEDYYYHANESTTTKNTVTIETQSEEATLTNKCYHSPSNPVLSTETVHALQTAAQHYFEINRKYEDEELVGSAVALGIERVDLANLLSNDNENKNERWKEELNDCLVQIVYPSIRSVWPSSSLDTHSEKTKDELLTNSQQQQQSSLLTVTSATIFANGGYAGSKSSMTTFERDAGLYVVHIDLGNEIMGRGWGDERGEQEEEAMGAIFMESLVSNDDDDDNDDNDDTENNNNAKQQQSPIVGPLQPGQMILHKSNERTAVLTAVPSDIHELECNALDCKQRTSIIQSSEGNRHYVLRLVLSSSLAIESSNNGNASSSSSSTQKEEEVDDDNILRLPPQAPMEERSYRLRSYARFRDDRVRYITLAGLLDVNDHENHLWLGFDYIARMTSGDEEDDADGNDASTDDETSRSVDLLHQQLSNANKAIYHLDKAARLCSTDSRVYFQLATALKAKMDCEKRLQRLLSNNDVGVVEKKNNIDNDDVETAYLTKMAMALERSAHLEGAAVKAGVKDIQDLTICLNALAEAYARMWQFDKTLNVIDKWAECGSIRSNLAIEDQSSSIGGGYNNALLPSYEWITTPDDNKNVVAVRTVGDVPVLEDDEIRMLRSAADKRFAIAAGVQTSRYTMQYEGKVFVCETLVCFCCIFQTAQYVYDASSIPLPLGSLTIGNSEVHLDDLCASDPILKTRMDTILKEKIYPLVRATIAEEGRGPDGSICVYDSILVRYNGEKAKAAGRIGASQPLVSDSFELSLQL